MKEETNTVETSPEVKRKAKQFEFVGLKDQKRMVKTVKVPIALEVLQQFADKAMSLTSLINELTRKQKEELPAEIKRLDAERTSLVTRYTEKKEPAAVDVLVGFDYDDKAPIVTTDARTNPPTETRVEFPLGKKWFVNIKTGEVYGPEPIAPDDLQQELPTPNVVGIETGAPKLASVKEYDAPSVVGDASATINCAEDNVIVAPGERVVEIDGKTFCGEHGDAKTRELTVNAKVTDLSDHERENGSRVTSIDSRRKGKTNKPPKGDKGNGE